MKFSGKMSLMIILKVTKKGIHPLSKRYIFRKTTRGVGLNACCLRISIRILHYTETQFVFVFMSKPKPAYVVSL